MHNRHLIGTQEDFGPHTLHSVHVGDDSFVVACTESGALRMFQDLCPHLDLPLSDGTVDADRIVCKWHGASFDIDTGEALTLPARCPLTRVHLQIDADQVYAVFDVNQSNSGEADA